MKKVLFLMLVYLNITIVSAQTDTKILNSYFGKPTEFQITVPENYNHDTQIDSSVARAVKEKIGSDAYITSAHFANASNKLVPGKTYIVKVFPILPFVHVSPEECVVFLHEQHAILTGAQGVTLVYDLAKEQLPEYKKIWSLDEKNSLFLFQDTYWIPHVYYANKSECHNCTSLGVGQFESECGWTKHSCILGFFEINL